MGKEATIGLAVILILLITFGVVLVRRLNRPHDGAATPAAKQHPPDSHKSGGDPAAKGAKTHRAAAGPSKLRVVAAKPASSEAPKLSPAAVGQFAVESDRDGKAPDTGAGVARVSPPSMMPNPPAPAWANSHDPYDSSLRQTKASQVRQLRPVSMSTQAAGSQPYDPFQGQTAQRPADETAQVGPMAGPLRSLGPPRQTSRQSGSSAYDYRGGGQYPADGHPARQTPAWRQPSPYTDPMQQQSQSLTGPEVGSSFDAPYGAQDLRNADGDYKVQPNDSYWVISQKLYGSGAYFKALAEHNRRKVPREDRLAVGEVISAPSVSELEKAYPDLCPKPSRRETVRNRASVVKARTPYVGGRIYVVEEGDTLFDIARYELGKASRWVEIYQLNRDLVGDDADYIDPGMELVLPDDEPSERVTRRPRSIYQP